MADRFVPVKLLLGEDREVSRRYRPFWTPTLFFLDPSGHALLDWPGFISASALEPLLDLGEALVDLRRGRFEAAESLLDRIPREHPGSPFAPEALWWWGVVRQVVKGDGQALADVREKILNRYPGSAAALRV